jgi:two-component system, NarL family, sensor histidine kinase UhpB
MWQNVPLQARINILFAVMLVVAISAHLVQVILSAGPRIQAEEDSMTRLAQEFVETAIASVRESPDPDAALVGLVEPLKSLRHVRIYLENRTDGTAGGDQSLKVNDGVPSWFTRLIRSQHRSIRVPVEIGGAKFGDIIIVARASDEIAEIWEGLVALAANDTAILAILFVLTAVVVRRALSPIRALDKALGQLRDHAYGTRISDVGPPELRRIFRRFNNLAEDLARTTEQNRLLTSKIISIQDDEWREIGRELHDEFGPYLFAIRAHASALVRRAAEARGEEGCEVQDIGQMILDQTDQLQKLNQRVLSRLRPPALDELGLAAAIGALADLWGEMDPSMDVTTRIFTPLADLDDSAALTVYRVVQESLTNAARHGAATAVQVTVEEAPRDPHAIRLTVADNGSGLREGPRAGFGLAGMSERVRALGGSVNIAQTGASGVSVSVILPVRLFVRQTDGNIA